MVSGEEKVRSKEFVDPSIDGDRSVGPAMDEGEKGNSGTMAHYSHNQNLRSLGVDRPKKPKLSCYETTQEEHKI